MLKRAFTAIITAIIALTIATPTHLSAQNRGSRGYTQTVGEVGPDDTVNEFFPTERGVGECISALPKPGCGSEAQGGWRQGLVFLSLVFGLAFIGWRIWASSRTASTRESNDP